MKLVHISAQVRNAPAFRPLPGCRCGSPGRLRGAAAPHRPRCRHPRRNEYSSIPQTARVRNKPSATATNAMFGRSSKPGLIPAGPTPMPMNAWSFSPRILPGRAPWPVPSAAPSSVPSSGVRAMPAPGRSSAAPRAPSSDPPPMPTHRRRPNRPSNSINQSAAAGRARADSYRRAIGACLQGRGYTVT